MSFNQFVELTWRFDAVAAETRSHYSWTWTWTFKTWTIKNLLTRQLLEYTYSYRYMYKYANLIEQDKSKMR